MHSHNLTVQFPSVFHMTQVGKQFKVTVDKRKLKLSTSSNKFNFLINATELLVDIDGEVRQCEQPSTTKCTILISVLASTSLLLFAGLALSLIVLKEKRVPCWHKVTTWFRARKNSENEHSANTAISAIELEQYVCHVTVSGPFNTVLLYYSS